jgi:hypothetical protein
VKGKTRIEIEREILAKVKKEMQKPRLTESVRNGLSAQAAQAAKNATRTLSRSTVLTRRNLKVSRIVRYRGSSLMPQYESWKLEVQS